MKAVWVSDATPTARPDRPESPHSEPDFVRGLRQGEASSFEHLYALYRPRIYNLALRTLHDAQEAEDATQETFLKAFQQIPRQNGDFKLEPWLYRVAVNTCFDHLRARRRRLTTPLAAEREPESLADGFAQAETGRLVEETLRKLSERHRVALVLKDLHGFTHEEIATVLGVSRGAAETLLFRAREAFRSAFGELSPSPSRRGEGCAYARSVALAVVGRDVSSAQRREFAQHAKKCPACRRSLELQGNAAVGLGLFVGQLVPPSPPGLPPVAVALAPVAAAVPAGAATGAAATLGGASSVGVLAKVVALVGGKTAVAVAAAAGVTLAGGTAAYTQLGHDGGLRTVSSSAAAAAETTTHGGGAKAGAGRIDETRPWGVHGRSHLARSRAKDKLARAEARHTADRKKGPGGNGRGTARHATKDSRPGRGGGRQAEDVGRGTRTTSAADEPRRTPPGAGPASPKNAPHAKAGRS